MPFTGSHPAAVLPFFRPLVPSALVIGSMVPDLGYYLPLPVSSSSMHSLPGVLGVDLLFGLACFLVWQVPVAPAVVAASPSALRARLGPSLPVAPTTYLRPGAALLVVASLWVGAATHVGWDEFTHSHRFGTAHLAWLASRHGPLPGYAWAQYASGVAGGLVLLLAVAHWWRTTEASGRQRVPALGVSSSLIGALVVVVATLVGMLWAAAYGATHQETVRHTLFLVASRGGGAGLAALLLMCLGLRGLARPGGSEPA